jgi:drug/metabolite transporter (DMT)-like permease
VPAAALLFALAAAFLHALWNVLLARSRDPQAATAVAFAVGAIAFAPVAWVTWDVERAVVPWVVASSALELLYLVLLAAAYSRAELSVFYPLARGLAPVFVLVVAVGALGHDAPAAQLVGVLLVACGVVAVRGLRVSAGRVSLGLGIAIAATIAAYTLVDNAGIEHASPIAYFELVLAAPAALYLGWIAFTRGGSALRAELRPATVVAGVASFGAFGLALAALDLAPAAPVAALRETSVVIATVLAAVLLGERVTRVRLVGAAIVAAGFAFIAAAS